MSFKRVYCFLLAHNYLHGVVLLYDRFHNQIGKCRITFYSSIMLMFKSQYLIFINLQLLLFINISRSLISDQCAYNVVVYIIIIT